MNNSKYTDNFDIFNDFSNHDKLRNVESVNINTQQRRDLGDVNRRNEDSEKFPSKEILVESLPMLNNDIRRNIKLSIAIFKKLNNFEHNYIHDFFNDKTAE